MKGDSNIRKMEHKGQITIFIIIAILIISAVTVIFMISPKLKNGEESPEKIYCKPEQRNADVCIQIYEPVCGFSEDNSQIKTFSNSCFSCIDENVLFYVAEECK